MRTLLPDFVAFDNRFVIDGRAMKRDLFIPQTFVIERSLFSFGQTVDFAGQTTPPPVAIVRADGHCIVYTSGGSGRIWFTGETMTSEQESTIGVLLDAMQSMGAQQGDKGYFSDVLPPV